MNKLLVVGVLTLSISLIVIGFLIIPESTIVIETISPQVICCGGGC